jgi:hypothetical protein
MVSMDPAPEPLDTDPLRALQFATSVPVINVHAADLPFAPGSYTIWHSDGRLLYAGLAGVRWTSERPTATSTLNRRLRDHLNALRADVLTSYLFERVVAPTLDTDQLEALGVGG